MASDEKTNQSRVNIGLCANCLHARRIESSRGSVFTLCQLSATDPRFRKYPPLPVLSCTGYTPAPAELK